MLAQLRTKLGMEGLGNRLRVRAAELGLSGAEVARRAGLTATRYGHYLKDYREPDLATLVRICRVLGLRPDEALGYGQHDPDTTGVLAKRAAIAAYVDVLDAGSLDLAVLVVQAIAATTGLRSTPPMPAAAAAPAKRPGIGKEAAPKDIPPHR